MSRLDGAELGPASTNSAQVGPRVPARSRPVSVRFRPPWGRHRPTSTHICPKSVKLEPESTRPELIRSELARTRTKSMSETPGSRPRTRPNSAQTRVKLALGRPTLGRKFGPTYLSIGRNRPTSARTRPNLARVWPNLVRFRMNLVHPGSGTMDVLEHRVGLGAQLNGGPLGGVSAQWVRSLEAGPEM